MIKLIVGTKGSGKTKAMIDMINDSVKTSKGNVVVVEKGMKLTYEIHNAARLIDLDEYKIAGGEMLYGFVAGLLASNYDITDLYIDGILKVPTISLIIVLSSCIFHASRREIIFCSARCYFSFASSSAVRFS